MLLSRYPVCVYIYMWEGWGRVPYKSLTVSSGNGRFSFLLLVVNLNTKATLLTDPVLEVGNSCGIA